MVTWTLKSPIRLRCALRPRLVSLGLIELVADAFRATKGIPIHAFPIRDYLLSGAGNDYGVRRAERLQGPDRAHAPILLVAQEIEGRFAHTCSRWLRSRRMRQRNIEELTFAGKNQGCI